MTKRPAAFLAAWRVGCLAARQRFARLLHTRPGRPGRGQRQRFWLLRNNGQGALPRRLLGSPRCCLISRCVGLQIRTISLVRNISLFNPESTPSPGLLWRVLGFSGLGLLSDGVFSAVGIFRRGTGPGMLGSGGILSGNFNVSPSKLLGPFYPPLSLPPSSARS